MKKLRLLFIEECNGRCDGCCNKDYDLASLPVCNDYSIYDEIYITGGEPMLYPGKVIALINSIRRESYTAKIIMYTAKTDYTLYLLRVLGYLDGLTITLHEESDVKAFELFMLNARKIFALEKYLLRLNVLKGVSIPKDTSGFQIKDNIEWIKNCPLPEDEVFMRVR